MGALMLRLALVFALAFSVSACADPRAAQNSAQAQAFLADQRQGRRASITLPAACSTRCCSPAPPAAPRRRPTTR